MRFSVLRFVFLLGLPALSPWLLFCQQKQAFALQNDISHRIIVDSTIRLNTLLEPFKPEMVISGLAISGSIALHSDSSLVRVVLLDNNYNEYLIYEAYPILSGAEHFSVKEAGEESSLLNNITPYRVSFELVDASLYLKEFILSGEESYRAKTKGAILLQQSMDKVDRINRNLQKRGQTWVAGETSISRLSYQEKKSMFGGRVPNFQGFEYYVGGVFVLPGALDQGTAIKSTHTERNVQSESPYPDEFSWRNRHGKDWVTPVKKQGCNDCWAFATTAATELMVNLYFNRNLDYDLSEQNVLSCTGGSCLGGPIYSALDFMQLTGIVFENCFPYKASEEDCSAICDDPSELIRIAHWEKILDEETKKKATIEGAITAHLVDLVHAAQVVGYKLLEVGDTIWEEYLNELQKLGINASSPLIGKTAWLIKNSWGESWGDNGFGYVVGGERGLAFYGVNGPVTSKIYNSSDILCSDADGDGYYYWGIGPKPPHCPESPEEADGDDSDPCISSMDEFGNLISFTPKVEAEDTIILSGQTVPDLVVSGSHIRWYSDNQLQNLLHTENPFPNGQTDPGEYVYFVTQTIAGCESAATQVRLSIVVEILPPTGYDTIIDEGEAAVLSAEGDQGAVIKWYEDPQLTVLLDSGLTYQTGKTAIGIYTYYVTQTKCLIESAPDTVFLEIVRPLAIPDHHFLDKLIDEGVDTNRDNRISYAEAEAITSLNITGSGIRDLTGIDAFVKLKTLECSNNDLTSLDVSACSELIHLGCSENQLVTLKVSDNEALTILDCSANRLTCLDLSDNPALMELDCSFNDLTTLDTYKNRVLASLDCSGNRLSSQFSGLDVSDNAHLENLNCSFNELSTLELSNNSALSSLDCSGNRLTSLEVSHNRELTDLVCCLNELTALDISNNIALRYLNCAANDISDLAISKNQRLEYLNCGSSLVMGSNDRGNPLISLDVSDSHSLKYLICESCQLSQLNVSNCTALTFLNCNNNQLSGLDVSSAPALDSLYCHGNQLKSLDLSNNAALLSLECGGNRLTSLDLSNNADLESLDCRNSQISSLNVSENKELDALLCTANQLTRLDVSACIKLETLKCDENQLASLELSHNPSLLILFCHKNQLTTLDISKNTSLFVLECGGNLLTRLDVSNNIHLRYFRINDMPTLSEMCVWTTPFPPSSLIVYVEAGSPNVESTTDCHMGTETEKVLDEELSFYPNPTFNVLTIKSVKPELYSIEITSPNGQVMAVTMMEGTTCQIDLSSLRKGVYFITLRSKDYVTTRKIVKL